MSDVEWLEELLDRLLDQQIKYRTDDKGVRHLIIQDAKIMPYEPRDILESLKNAKE